MKLTRLPHKLSNSYPQHVNIISQQRLILGGNKNVRRSARAISAMINQFSSPSISFRHVGVVDYSLGKFRTTVTHQNYRQLADKCNLSFTFTISGIDTNSELGVAAAGTSELNDFEHNESRPAVGATSLLKANMMGASIKSQRLMLTSL